MEESYATAAITAVAHSRDSHTTTTAASSLEQQFKQNVLQKYSTAQDAWQVFNSISDGEGISRRDFKTVLAMLGMKGAATKEKGALRKKMDLQVVRGTVTPCSSRSFTFPFPHVHLEHQNHHIRRFFGNVRWAFGQSSCRDQHTKTTVASHTLLRCARPSRYLGVQGTPHMRLRV